MPGLGDPFNNAPYVVVRRSKGFKSGGFKSGKSIRRPEFLGPKYIDII